MVLQHAKRIVAAGPGDAIEGSALGENVGCAASPLLAEYAPTGSCATPMPTCGE